MAPLWSKKRFVVVNLLVAVEGVDATAARTLAVTAVDAIAAAGTDFARVAAELARVARALRDFDTSVAYVGHVGDVYNNEDDAAAAVAEATADLAGRYGDEAAAAARSDVAVPEIGRRITVVMMTIAYSGEEPALESDEVATSLGLPEALTRIEALARTDRLLAAHLHVAPAHPDDRLSEDQLLMYFPELIAL